MGRSKARNGPAPNVIERNSVVPLYVQIAKAIEAEIASGALQSGEPLESENKLSKRLSISRVTTRLAIDKLVELGLVERRQGKGTYVAHRAICHDFQSFDQILDTLFAQGHNPASKLLTFGSAKPPREIAAAFKTSQSGELVQLERLYLIDKRPVGMAQGWLTSQARGVTRVQAEAHSTAYILANILRLRLEKTELIVRADTLGRTASRRLGMPARTPALILLRKRFLTDGRLAEIARVTMNSHFYEVSATASDSTAVSAALQVRAA